MRIKLFLKFFFLPFLFFISCSQKESCDNLPKTFTAYDEAFEQIKSANFKISESVNTSKSSWIRNASYYSCDGLTGFFILETSEKEYLFSDLPYYVWRNFATAESFGSFYHQKIRNKYTVHIEK